MNAHFHAYQELSSPPPHPASPSSEGIINNYSTASGVGGGGSTNLMVHQHSPHHAMPRVGPQQLLMESHHNLPGQINYHHSNNNNNTSITNNNNINNSANSIKQCSGCGGKIAERFFLHALDRFWHNSCLKCYCCGALLADIGASCYTRGGMILCKADYARMFVSGSCSSCGQTIAANEFVMRTTTSSSSANSQNHHQQQQQQQSPSSALDNQKPQQNFPNQVEHHVFHLKCFVCSKCTSQLRPGDRYYMLAGSLVCEPDWHKLLKNSTTNAPIRKGKVGRPRRSRD